jgi:hypothetical protein
VRPFMSDRENLLQLLAVVGFAVCMLVVIWPIA